MVKKKNFRILNCIESKNKEKDWSATIARKSGILRKSGSLPLEKDLREPWWKINDQGETGSCVGWASVDSVIRWHFVKAGLLPKNKLLSPRFIWMASKETDEYTNEPTTFIESEGTSLKASLDIARKYGTVTEDFLPFDSGKLFQGETDEFFSIASRLKIRNYHRLDDPSDWRDWLAFNGPILSRLVVDKTWDDAWDNPIRKGRLDTYKPHKESGGHAIAIVGYDKKYFIVRNSWGPKWGDRGYGYATESYAKKAFDEAFGVSI